MSQQIESATSGKFNTSKSNNISDSANRSIEIKYYRIVGWKWWCGRKPKIGVEEVKISKDTNPKRGKYVLQRRHELHLLKCEAFA